MSRYDMAPLLKEENGNELIITAGWGDNRGHQGVDWGRRRGIRIGSPVFAPFAGTIIAVLYDGEYNPVTKRHTAGYNIHLLGHPDASGRRRRRKYFHLNKADIRVHPGQQVTAGEQIAGVGNSGTQAAHLHEEDHEGNFSNPVNNDAAAREVLTSNRFVDATPPAPEPPPTPNVPDPEEPSMADIQQLIDAIAALSLKVDAVAGQQLVFSLATGSPRTPYRTSNDRSVFYVDVDAEGKPIRTRIPDEDMLGALQRVGFVDAVLIVLNVDTVDNAPVNPVEFKFSGELAQIPVVEFHGFGT